MNNEIPNDWILSLKTSLSDNINLNIKHVRKDLIVFRSDLTRYNKDKSFDDVTYHDFKSSVLTQEQINKASTIEFIDGDKCKMLKDKYANYSNR